MSDVVPDMYAGLDQMIARSTAVAPGAKQPRPKQKAGPAAEKPVPLTPDEPKPLAFYRKQTFYLGAEDLNFLEQAQDAMQAQYKHEVFKNELVRAALELLAKDFEINKDKSFLVRKFVRR